MLMSFGLCHRTRDSYFHLNCIIYLFFATRASWLVVDLRFAETNGPATGNMSFSRQVSQILVLC